MAPRINASGRLAHADLAVHLLTTDNAEEALAAAVRLDELNKERQQMVEEMVQEAEKQLEKKKRFARFFTGIFRHGRCWRGLECGRHWHRRFQAD